LTNIGTILGDIIERLNKTTVSLIAIFTLIGMGFSVGIYYEDAISNAQIMELKNQHTLELIEIKNQQSLKIIELQKIISLLEVKNEQRKK